MSRGSTIVFCVFVIVPALRGAEAGGLSIRLGSTAADMEYDAARGRVYVSVPALDQVLIISTGSYEISKRVVCGSRPRGLALSSDGRQLFVALNDGPLAALLDLETLTQSIVDVSEGLGDGDAFDIVEARPRHVFVAGHGGGKPRDDRPGGGKRSPPAGVLGILRTLPGGESGPRLTFHRPVHRGRWKSSLQGGSRAGGRSGRSAECVGRADDAPRGEPGQRAPAS
jgi:hypothetical protein